MLCVLAMTAAVTRADLAVTRIEADGQSLPLPAETITRTLQLPVPSKSLSFHFTEDPPTSRIRYKLEGYDETWQDTHDNKAIRMAVQFQNAAGLMVRQRHFYETGSTPGWKGRAELSRFHPRRQELTAPPNATSIRVTFAAGHGMPTTGIIGIDACKVIVRNPRTGAETVHNWTLTPEATEGRPLTASGRWISRGTRSKIATIRTRPHPTPHPILVLEDNFPDYNAHWTMAPSTDIPVAPGDLCIIEWQTAFSAGSCGPGSATYPDLEPGRYLFRISAAEANGRLTGDGLTIPVEIIPPLYQRSGFWLVITGLGLAATTIGSRFVILRRARHHRAEIEHQQALEAERARIARDLHDQIGANLARISLLTELADNSLDDTEQARRQLDKVYATARDVTKQLDSVVWAVDPANDSLESFARYLHGHAEEYLALAGVRCHFTRTDELPELGLVSHVRHHLMMVAREALHNIVSHSRAKVATIGLTIQDRHLVMEIEDDGCGLPAGAQLVPGNGLNNMRSRAEAIQGSLVVSPGRDGTGTLIRLTMPL